MMVRVRRLTQAAARRAASRYVVGPELDDAIAMCRCLADQQVRTTICAWNAEDSLAEDNAGRCLAGIEAIAAARLDCYLSLKALDMRFSTPLLYRIAAHARQSDTALHFDSMGPESSDETFAILRQLARPGLRLGVSIPGRWRRSPADAEWAADLGLRVRVVKGQWADPDEPAMDVRTGFARVIEHLCGRAQQVAVATHDPVLARSALDRLRKSGTDCELELLFGLPFRYALGVGREMAVPIRIYVPYGHAWLPYAFRQIAKNPKIALWTLRDLLGGQGSDPRQVLRI